MRPGAALGRAALLLVALALPLLAFELVLAMWGEGEGGRDSWRTRGLHQPDDELIYSLRPSAAGEWSTSEFTERATTNAMGLRGDEISPARERRSRILIIGDSMTFGHGVANDEAYPARLAGLLDVRRPDAGVEVINAGVKGYGTDHAYKLFSKRLRALEPDVLIFALNHNDYEDNIRYPLYRLEGGQLVELDATASPLYRVARASEMLPGAIAGTRTARWCIQTLVALSTQPADAAVGSDELVGREQWKILRQIASLRAMAREDGFELLIIGLPFRDGSWEPFRWLTGALGRGAVLLDLSRDPSWQQQKERWFFRSDEHLNPAGHRRVAAELDRFLAARDWLAAPPPSVGRG